MFSKNGGKIKYTKERFLYAKWLSRNSITSNEGYEVEFVEERTQYLKTWKTFKKQPKSIKEQQIKKSTKMKSDVKNYEIDEIVLGKGLSHKKKLLKNKEFVSATTKLSIVLMMMIFIAMDSTKKLNISWDSAWHLIVFTLTIIIISLPSLLFPYFLLKGKDGIEKYESRVWLVRTMKLLNLIVTLALLLSTFYFDYLFKNDIDRVQIANTVWEDRKYIGLYTVGLTLVSFVFKLIQLILWLIKRHIFKTEKELNSIKIKNTILFFKQNNILTKQKTSQEAVILMNNQETQISENILRAKVLFETLKQERGFNEESLGKEEVKNV